MGCSIFLRPIFQNFVFRRGVMQKSRILDYSTVSASRCGRTRCGQQHLRTRTTRKETKRERKEEKVKRKQGRKKRKKKKRRKEAGKEGPHDNQVVIFWKNWKHETKSHEHTFWLDVKELKISPTLFQTSKILKNQGNMKNKKLENLPNRFGVWVSKDILKL